MPRRPSDDDDGETKVGKKAAAARPPAPLSGGAHSCFGLKWSDNADRKFRFQFWGFCGMTRLAPVDFYGNFSTIARPSARQPGSSSK